MKSNGKEKVYNAVFEGENNNFPKAAVKQNKKTPPIKKSVPQSRVGGKVSENKQKTNQRPRPAKAIPKARQTNQKTSDIKIQKGSRINESIRVQTKSSRTKGRQEKKITGSAKNLEIKRRTHNEKKTFRIKKKRNNFKYYSAMLFIYLLVFAVIGGLFAVFFSASLKSGTSNDNTEIKISIGSDDDEMKNDFTSTDFYKSGIYYLSPDDINELFSLTVTGDKKELKYITEENGEYISFIIGTRNATVNGQNVLLEDNCFLKNGRLYAPASFFQSYVSGVTYTLDKAKGISIERIETGKDKDGNTTYSGLAFSLKANNAIPVIPEESISK